MRRALILVLLLAAPRPGLAQEAPADNTYTITADHARYGEADKQGVFDTGVAITYRDLTLKGDKLTVDTEKQEGTFEGGVTLTGKGQEVAAQGLTIQLRDRVWHADEAAATLSPDYFQGNVVEPLYLRGDNLQGSPQRITLDSPTFTSCSLAPPHYAIRARSAEIVPGQYLLARRPAFWVEGRRWFSLPDLNIPLRTYQRPSYLPEVGRTDLEGWYAKTSYAYTSRQEQRGTVLVDLMEKQGIATGLRHEYAVVGGTGLAYLYHQWKQKSLTANFQHSQQFGQGTQANANLSYVENSYYFVGRSTRLTSNLNLRSTSAGANTVLAVTSSSSKTSMSSHSLASNFEHRQDLGGNVQARIAAQFQDFSTGPGQHDNLELFSALELGGPVGSFDWTVTQDKRSDLDRDDYAGDQFSPWEEKLPDLVLASRPAAPLALPGGVTSAVEFRLGRITDTLSGNRVFRSSVDLRPQSKTVSLGGGNRLVLGGAFRQSFFESNAAQYLVDGRANLELNPGGGWRWSTNYAYRRPEGYSPLSFDQMPTTHNIGTSLTLQKPDVSLALSTGYDLRRSLWRDLSLTSTIGAPSRGQARLTTGYDLERSQFRPVTLTFMLNQPQKVNLQANAYYDAQMGKLRTVRASLDWQATPEWLLELRSGYNALTGKLDYTSARITRDLHCWLARLTYNKQRNELNLSLSIKAFPVFDRFFGFGGSGSLLDPTSGQIY